jgi:hypothetical protein
MVKHLDPSSAVHIIITLNLLSILILHNTSFLTSTEISSIKWLLMKLSAKQRVRVLERVIARPFITQRFQIPHRGESGNSLSSLEVKNCLFGTVLWVVISAVLAGPAGFLELVGRDGVAAVGARPCYVDSTVSDF